MMKRSGFVMLILLFAAIPAVLAADVTLEFEPQHSCVSEGYGSNTTVELWLDIPAGLQVSHGQLGIDHDPTCGDIIDHNFNTDIMTGVDPSWAFWNSPPLQNDCWDDDMDWVVFKFWIPKSGPIRALIGNFTIHGNSTDYCISNLDFSHIPGCSQGWPILWDSASQEQPINLSNGTFECGTPSAPKPFSKLLYEGWNLISLPLDPEDNTASAVLSTVSYDAVYRYNATAPKQFEDLESTDAMDPGTGYFVHVTGDCTWSYSGNAYNSMDLSLEPGLNMVGWLNCSKDVDDALSSISGDYRYVARWNTSTQKFEVYNPAAPSFNDIRTMDRGTGYFISAKQSCALSEEC